MTKPPPEEAFRAVCLRCRRPEVTCWCAAVTPIESAVRACFLQHPRERRVPIGTARMAHLALPNSELHSGIDFGDHARVRELAAAPGTAVLFPGEGAVAPETLVGTPPRVLIVIDGTWSQARKVIHVNPFLQALPRVGFTPLAPSNYRIRKQPEETFVSTIEAVAHVLAALEGDAEKFRRLLEPFERMVDVQLEYIARRPGPPRVRRKREKRARVDGTIAALLRRPQDVVALYAEGNGSFTEPELIRLMAVRLATGERLDARVAPRSPLGPDVPAHVELDAATIAAGGTLDAALEQFRAFVREGDLFCGWGPYAIELLRREGFPERDFSDLRVAAARRLKRRPGGVEQAVRLFGLPELPQPLGPGRAGRRLAALVLLLELLQRPSSADLG